MDLEEIYLANRASIDQAIRSVCRRQRLSTPDGEDFASEVHLRLIQGEYTVLRKFEGRSSLRTYLATVVTHLYQDWRNARWGKWRPSEAAKRRGAVAVQLERLLTRDGLTFEEACETLRTNCGVTESQKSLEALAAGLSIRPPRRFVGEEALHEHPGTDRIPDEALQEREAAAAAARALATLTAATARLPPQDYLILKMRFHEEFSIADIARFLQLDQKGLYRRIQRVLAQLRAGLQEAGLTEAAAVLALEQGGFDAVDDAGAGREIAGGVRPFDQDGHSPAQTTRTR